MTSTALPRRAANAAMRWYTNTPRLGCWGFGKRLVNVRTRMRRSGLLSAGRWTWPGTFRAENESGVETAVYDRIEDTKGVGWGARARQANSKLLKCNSSHQHSRGGHFRSPCRLPWVRI